MSSAILLLIEMHLFSIQIMGPVVTPASACVSMRSAVYQEMICKFNQNLFLLIFTFRLAAGFERSH